jgi:hypothetical protein
MRPTYETAKDRVKEAAVAETIGRHFNCFAKKLPLSYPLDFVMVRDRRVEGWLEVKCRNYASTDFDTLMLSCQKYSAAIRLSSVTGRPVNLAVQWTDMLGFLNLPCDGDVIWGGRSDRGDWQDAEPCMHFPIAKFRRIA